MTPVPAGRCGELRGRKDARSAVLRDAHDASSCGTALARRGSPPRGSRSGLLEARAL